MRMPVLLVTVLALLLGCQSKPKTAEDFLRKTESLQRA